MSDHCWTGVPQGPSDMLSGLRHMLQDHPHLADGHTITVRSYSPRRKPSCPLYHMLFSTTVSSEQVFSRYLDHSRRSQFRVQHAADPSTAQLSAAAGYWSSRTCPGVPAPSTPNPNLWSPSLSNCPFPVCLGSLLLTSEVALSHSKQR